MKCSAPLFKPYSPSVPAKAPAKGDFDFELSTIDTAREVYFLPQVDRLAAKLAAESDTPLKVRVEAQGQFIEYVITKDPMAPIQASLNGIPYESTAAPSQSEEGALVITGRSAAGDLDGDLYQVEDGTQMTGLAGPNRMPFGHTLSTLKQNQPSDPIMESRGNFACARMTHTYWPDQKVEGNLGVHSMDATFSQCPEGNGYLLQGSFGDMQFRQTFTRLPAESGDSR